MRARFAFFALAVAACSPLPGDFICATDEQCASGEEQGGRCEPERRCSFLDTGCTSGRRYASHAGELSDRCLTVGCAEEVRAGEQSTCAWRSDAAWCWGASPGSLPAPISLLSDALAELDVGAGALRCERYESGRVVCGGGAEVASGEVPGGVFVDVATGRDHACGIIAGRVACWGHNGRGQLGDGLIMNRRTPVFIVVDADGELSDVRQVAASGDNSCAVTGVGTVWCWGDDTQGQLGRGGGSAMSSTPVRVELIAAPLVDVRSVALGSQFACAVTQPGELWCWGRNDRRQLGAGHVITSRPGKTLMSGVSQVTAGGAHACMLASDGALSCWGANDDGQCGVSRSQSRVDAPMPVVDAAGAALRFLSIDAGGAHTCGRLSASGALLCWGSNAVGQLGTGTSSGPAPVPPALDCR